MTIRLSRKFSLSTRTAQFCHMTSPWTSMKHNRLSLNSIRCSTRKLQDIKIWLVRSYHLILPRCNGVSDRLDATLRISGSLESLDNTESILTSWREWWVPSERDWDFSHCCCVDRAEEPKNEKKIWETLQVPHRKTFSTVFVWQHDGDLQSVNFSLLSGLESTITSTLPQKCSQNAYRARRYIFEW